MIKSLKQQIPIGVKDMLPHEAAQKRRLENTFENIFNCWGYKEVVTPVFEYYATLSVGREGYEDDKLYKFIDRQGQILALRPDITTPIARLVSTRMRDWKLPLRLFYMANVFSFEDPQAGRQREFYQAGIELIGEPDPVADAEAIAVAAEVVKTSGVQNFKISIGHVDVLHGMTEEFELNDEQVAKLKTEISNKNYVGLQELLSEFDISEVDRDKFMQVITLRGNKEVIKKAGELINNAKTVEALEDLGKVYDALAAYEITDKVEIDLGVLRDLDYYTGVVFEGYSAYLGYPILGGGRYDNLLGQFGFNVPATGFALGLDRLMLALQKEGSLTETIEMPDYLIKYTPERAAEAFKKARELRSKSHVVLTSQINRSNENIFVEAREIIWLE